jgi:hypothetical protein
MFGPPSQVNSLSLHLVQKSPVTSAPHWAIADLLDERVDLDALAEEAVKEGLTSKLYTDHDPLLFLLDRNNPQLPRWLPEVYDRPLSPEERLA